LSGSERRFCGKTFNSTGKVFIDEVDRICGEPTKRPTAGQAGSSPLVPSPAAPQLQPTIPTEDGLSRLFAGLVKVSCGLTDCSLADRSVEPGTTSSPVGNRDYNDHHNYNTDDRPSRFTRSTSPGRHLESWPFPSSSGSSGNTCEPGRDDFVPAHIFTFHRIVKNIMPIGAELPCWSDGRRSPHEHPWRTSQ